MAVIMRLLVTIYVICLPFQCYIFCDAVNVPTEQKQILGVGCTKNEFTCGDNSCIPISAACNGTSECSNGEDESDDQCSIIHTARCTGTRKYSRVCDLISDSDNPLLNFNKPQFYCLTDSLRNGTVPVVCLNGVWTPQNAICLRVCEPIVLPTANFRCIFNGKDVDCYRPLLVGTKIYPLCDFYYTPNISEVICKPTGEWNHKNLECSPVCGRQFKSNMKYTKTMRSAEYREFPWSVAIYYTKPGTTSPILIPGTIISPYLIITTAINFYSDYRWAFLNLDAVVVVVAKRTKELEASDDQFQKYYKVQDIFFTDVGYQSNEFSLTSENIAIIQLSEKIVLSPSVYPVCVNWAKNESLYPVEGTIGQIPHTLTIYEANASATFQHEILQTTATRIMSREQCLNTDVMKTFTQLVRLDNFCSESIPAPAPCDGAFVYKEMNTNLFFIQGVVDGVTPLFTSSPSFINTLIDLSSHHDWITSVRKKTENQLVANEVLLSPKAVTGNLDSVCNLVVKEDDMQSIRVRSTFKAVDQHSNQSRTSSFDGCFLPSKDFLNAYLYSISCPLSSLPAECSRIKENGTTPQFAALKLQCKKTFVPHSDNEFLCFKGNWNPELKPCEKICAGLPKLENGHLSCIKNNIEIDCNGKLSVGTRLLPKCDSDQYMLEWQSENKLIYCNDTGGWNSPLPKCTKKSTGNKKYSGSSLPTSSTRFGTREKEENPLCPINEVSCGKTCIPKSAFCNGTIECDDGTDESDPFCKVISTFPCSGSMKLDSYCSQSLKLDSVNRRSSMKNNADITPHTSFLCQINDSTSDVPLSCVKSIATPSTLPCKRICSNISVTLSGMECFLNDTPVDCKKPLLVGTKLIPHCNSGYKPNADIVFCNTNGEWSSRIVECVPECGKANKNNTRMSRNIRAAQFREFPWNVAIYKKSVNPPILFAGIIISPYLILTNAKCCISEMNSGQPIRELLDVVVGKRSSDMETEDDDGQKTIKVKSVHIPEKLVDGLESIALIELSDPITMCTAVKPVCVNWHNNMTINPIEGTLGMVPHWRTRNQNNSDTTHELLQTVALALLSRESCQKRINKNFLKYLTKDGFCVEPIALLTPAHRGAGFIYEEQFSRLHYVQGIIYFTGIEHREPIAFTNMFFNITRHIDWLNSIRLKSEKLLHQTLLLNDHSKGVHKVCKNESADAVIETRMNINDRSHDVFALNGCLLPIKDWLYMDYTVNCLPNRKEDVCQQAISGARVPEFATLSITCNEGFVSNNSNEVICFRTKWSPPIEPCKKVCDKLQLENAIVKCFWEGKRVNCNDVLKSGTESVVECAANYQPVKALPKLICNEFGHWNNIHDVACSHFDPWNDQVGSNRANTACYGHERKHGKCATGR